MTRIVRGPLKAIIGTFAMEDANPVPVPFRAPKVQGSPLVEPVAAEKPSDSHADKDLSSNSEE